MTTSEDDRSVAWRPPQIRTCPHLILRDDLDAISGLRLNADLAIVHIASARIDEALLCRAAIDCTNRPADT